MPASPSEQEGSRHDQCKEASLAHSCKDFDTLETSELCSNSSLEFGSLGPKVGSHVEESDGHHLTEDEEIIIDAQRNHQDKLLCSPAKSSSETSMTNMKRDSPVGNDDTGMFSEHCLHNKSSSDIFEKLHSSQEQVAASSETLMKSLSQVPDFSGVGMEVVEDVVRPTSRPLSRRSSGSETRDSLRGSRPPSIGADFVHGSNQSSLKHSQSMDAIDFHLHSKESDRFSPDCLRTSDHLKRDSSRYKPTNEQAPERSRASANLANSIHGTPSKERNSPLSESIQLSPRVTAQREVIGDHVYTNKGRITENREVVNTGSPLSARPPSHPGSRSSILYPSRTQSLSSMTSDQELAQLFEQSRASSAISLPHIDSLSMKEADRSSNIPSWTTQLQVLSPSGEFLPYKSYPPSDTERNNDILDRSSAVSRILTCTGSRTTTPVPVANRIREVNNDHIQELEASVANLRKLLSSREAEVHSLTSQLKDLKDINRSLREELEHRGKRHTPVSSLQDSFEYKQLQSEKEILASEVVILRDELQRLNKGQITDGKRGLSGSKITDYSPNSPAVLQRKIADLEVHISDLQEVNESTNSSLLQSEKQLKLLQDENKDLKSRSHSIHEHQTQGDRDLRVELRTLREDICHLKERNYQLTEENMRLIEGQKSKNTSANSSNGGSSLNTKAETSVDRPTTNYTTSAVASKYETSFGSHETSERGRAVLTSPAISQKISHEYLAPREMRKSTFDSRANESQLPQYLNNSDSLLHYQPRNSLMSSKSIETLRKNYEHSDRKDYQTSDRKDNYQHSDRKDYNQPSDRRDNYQHSDRKDYNKTSDRRDNYQHFDRKDYQPSDRKDYQHSDRKDYQYSDRKDYQHFDRKNYNHFDRKDYQHFDRSKPDGGEVSDKLYLDKYTTLVPSYEKRSVEDKPGNGESYLDKHSLYKPQRLMESTELWSREKSDTRDKGDKYRNLKDTLQDNNSRVSSLDRVTTSGSAISSRDIFLNLQQKRASRSTQQDTKYISGNSDYQRFPSTRTYLENAGDDSDTATDILIGQDINPRGLVHRRRTSLGSDDSPSSISDVEDSTDSLLRRRSKSTDSKRGQDKQLSTLFRSESASRPLTSAEQVSSSVGFRSIIQPPLVTQHNKGEMSSKNITSVLSSSLTQGMRPFAPRSPADIRVDDVIKFSRPGGKLTQGIVKYVGRLPGRSEAYLGVELDKDEGKHDGTFEDIRYFKCKPNKGVFVAFNKVVMAWAP